MFEVERNGEYELLGQVLQQLNQNTNNSRYLLNTHGFVKKLLSSSRNKGQLLRVLIKSLSNETLMWIYEWHLLCVLNETSLE